MCHTISYELSPPQYLVFISDWLIDIGYSQISELKAVWTPSWSWCVITSWNQFLRSFHLVCVSEWGQSRCNQRGWKQSNNQSRTQPSLICADDQPSTSSEANVQFWKLKSCYWFLWHIDADRQKVPTWGGGQHLSLLFSFSSLQGIVAPSSKLIFIFSWSLESKSLCSTHQLCINFGGVGERR